MRLWMMGFTLCMLISGCNLNTPDTDTQAENTPTPPVETATSLPQSTLQPSPTYTATSIIPPSQTPVSRITTDAPTQVATQSSEGAAPIGERDTRLPPVAVTAEATATIIFPTTFPDRYTTTVNAGQTLLVNYTVTLTSGRIYIVVRDPTDAEIARLFVNETIDDTLEVPVETSGEHTILVAFENLSGNYSVTFGFR